MIGTTGDVGLSLSSLFPDRFGPEMKKLYVSKTVVLKLFNYSLSFVSCKSRHERDRSVGSIQSVSSPLKYQVLVLQKKI